jgi:hypothetical protein
VCVECSRETTGPEKGWQAVLAGGVEDELEVAVYWIRQTLVSLRVNPSGTRRETQRGRLPSRSRPPLGCRIFYRYESAAQISNRMPL